MFPRQKHRMDWILMISEPARRAIAGRGQNFGSGVGPEDFPLAWFFRPDHDQLFPRPPNMITAHRCGKSFWPKAAQNSCLTISGRHCYGSIQLARAIPKVAARDGIRRKRDDNVQNKLSYWIRLRSMN